MSSCYSTGVLPEEPAAHTILCAETDPDIRDDDSTAWLHAGMYES